MNADNQPLLENTGAGDPKDSDRSTYKVAIVAPTCRYYQVPLFQKLAAHHGARLSPVAGHVAMPHPLVVASDSGMPLAERPVVNSFHEFGLAAADLGPNMIAAARSPDGLVEAAVHRSLPHWGIMWHPERSPYDPGDLEIIRSLFG